MTAITTKEHRVPTEDGRLYAKQWQVTAATPSDLPPIVLLHDSLGCVALWRDFSERRTLATGRDVIAYDRLGYGQSDSHPGRLQSPNFVLDEAGQGFRAVHAALGLDRFIAF